MHILPLNPAHAQGPDLEFKMKFFAEEYSKKDPRSLSHPQKKNRFCYCMFGYDLLYFKWAPFFKAGQILSAQNLGRQKYSKGAPSEKNGQIYTCNGGFIDTSHMRAGIDWGAYIALNIAAGNESIELDNQDKSHFKITFDFSKIKTEEDVQRIAERIAFERLTYHEIASWHYVPPLKTFGEQISAFSPEDQPSNFLGARIGARVAIEMLNGSPYTYSQLVDREIMRQFESLRVVKSTHLTKAAFDQVNRANPANDPEKTWYDSNIAMSRNEYCFQRNFSHSGIVETWLVPRPEEIGCDGARPEYFVVHDLLEDGTSIHDAYSFRISPSAKLFGTERRPNIFEPFPAFETRDLDQIVHRVSANIQKAVQASDF